MQKKSIFHHENLKTGWQRALIYNMNEYISKKYQTPAVHKMLLISDSKCSKRKSRDEFENILPVTKYV